MRLCVATRTYPTVTETFVFESVDALRAAGADVQVLATRRGRGERDALGVPAIAVGGAATLGARATHVLRHWAQGRRARHDVRSASAGRCAPAWDSDYRAALPALRTCDVLLAHFGYVGVEWLPVAALARRRMAVYFHGSDATRWVARAPRMYDGLFTSGVGLLTNSDFLAARLAAIGAPPQAIRVVPLAAHPAFSAQPSPPALEAPTVVTIARLVEKKGVDDALTTFARACESLPPQWCLHVIGSGPERGALRRLALRLGVADRVRFTPAASRRDVLGALAGASVFLLTSRTAANGDTEGTPVAVIEAATMGVPVVATRHAGIPELLPPEAGAGGWLAEERDVRALAAALVGLAQSREARRQWGARCLAHARARASAEGTARAMLDALQDVARIPEWTVRT